MLSKQKPLNTEIFDHFESEVRYYSRIFPTIFSKAKGSRLYDVNNKQYIDFFSGAGALNYGHNNNKLKQKLLSYIRSDQVTHSLDMMTEAKMEMIYNFQNIILKNRNLEYKLQFTGPTGTDTIEAALKLARKYTKRKNIVYFTNSYHGMSMGSLSITPKKDKIGIPIYHTTEMPFEQKYDNSLEQFLSKIDRSEYPAAIVIETVQAEGGINVASSAWLKHLREISKKNQILLIIDDIQTGIGRTGDFFSFERANIEPDMICLSKSLSGYGLPLSLLLIKPEFDIWDSGEHTGTFRGNNLAFVTANEAILQYWQNNDFSDQIKKLSNIANNKISKIIHNSKYKSRGIGLIHGIELTNQQHAFSTREICFKQGLLVETCGPKKSVIKIIPPLNITNKDLSLGLEILESSIKKFLGEI